MTDPDLLTDLEAYLDRFADADLYGHDGFIPNEAMRLLQRVRAEIEGASVCPVTIEDIRLVAKHFDVRATS